MLTKNKLFILFLFGIVSGFTLMISSSTLNYWMAKEGINIKTIGLFSLASLPYAINFVWAPLFDTTNLPRLADIFGHRLSWLIVLQVCLILAILALSQINPLSGIYLFALCSLLVSFFSSAQDTVLGALRTEIIAKESQGAASGVYIFGYRVGMLVSSSGAILASKYFSWSSIYLSFVGILILLASLLVYKLKLYKELLDEEPQEINDPTKISNFIKMIIRPIGSTKFILLVIVFLILYRLSDNFIAQMINPFLIHIGYDEVEVASVGKFFGILGSIIGGLIASLVMRKRTIEDSLLIFGILHAAAHGCFIIQEIYGKNLGILFFVIGFESITGGMAMAAYIALIASLCQGKFRATQYSFLSSMMGFSRSILPTLSGYIVYDFGWQYFFTFATVAAIPALLIIKFIKR